MNITRGKTWQDKLASYRRQFEIEDLSKLHGRAKAEPLAITVRYFKEGQAGLAATLLNRGEKAVAIETHSQRLADEFAMIIRNSCNLNLRTNTINDEGFITLYVVKEEYFKLFLAQLDTIYNG